MLKRTEQNIACKTKLEKNQMSEDKYNVVTLEWIYIQVAQGFDLTSIDLLASLFSNCTRKKIQTFFFKSLSHRYHIEEN